jgi:quercetin dioxygenase-like cupin family protein
MTAHRPFDPAAFDWDGVETRAYKDGEGPYSGVTRRVLFAPGDDLPVEWRYFEIAPGGWSTLERHDHSHAVVVVRGRGRALVGGVVRRVAAFDLIRIAPLDWHQFRADADAPLGFFCLVAADRDRPRLPSAEDVAALSADPSVAVFIRP